MLLLNWALSSCWDVHTFVVPILGHERGLPASVIGTILGAFAIAAAVIRMLIPILTRHLAEWQVVLGAMVSACILFIAYPFMPGAWSMGAVRFFWGSCWARCNPW